VSYGRTFLPGYVDLSGSFSQFLWYGDFASNEQVVMRNLSTKAGPLIICCWTSAYGCHDPFVIGSMVGVSDMGYGYTGANKHPLPT